MTVIILGVVGFVIFGGFIFLIHQALASEKRQGELEKEIEDARHINELQKTYADIASRPSSSAHDIIKWLREKPPANK